MNIVKESRYGPIIFSKNDLYIGKSFNLYGEFSYQEVDFLKDLIEPGDMVIDVGANIGGITIPLAQKLGLDGYMVAFEPQQYIYYTLCGNVAVNNLLNTACFQRLVCDVDGEVRNMPILDYTKELNFGDNSTKKATEETACTPVSTCTIDSLQLSRPNLIKIDVQGEELDVLQGAKKTIERARPFMYVECEDEEESHRIVEFFSQFNYKCLFHRPPLFNTDNFFGEKEDVFDKIDDDKIVNLMVSGNTFAYPEEKKEWDETIERNFFVENFGD
tara:strand:- start:48936 stop:49754 length:819 start_codon:yes stop_codon:yes gene_type:complete